MYGPWGALTSTGELVLETRQWRDRLFMSRMEPTGQRAPSPVGAVRDRIQGVMFPGMGGWGGGMGVGRWR
jgi:hypothetical protein